MKKLLPLLLLFIFQFSFGQINLVPNPSFELHTGCPTGGNEMSLCTDWWNAGGDSTYSTSDYWNECSSNPPAKPPNVYCGYQVPENGVAYCGVVCYDINPTSYREYIQSELTQALIVGQSYYVSFYASLPGLQGASYGTNKLGALFTTYRFQAPHWATPNNYSQVYTNSILTDTVNWFHLKGSFIADSAYQYITIGNFYDNLHTDTINVNSIPIDSYFSYYYIDEVCVSTDSALCYSSESIPEITLQNLVVYPNPANESIVIEHDTETLDEGKIYNVMWQSIVEFKINKNDKITINCSQWSNGVYFIETKKQFQKIIIQHSK